MGTEAVWVPLVAAALPAVIGGIGSMFAGDAASAGNAGVDKAGADKLFNMQKGAQAYGAYRPQIMEAQQKALANQMAQYKPAENMLTSMYGGSFTPGGAGGDSGGYTPPPPVVYTPAPRAGLGGPLTPRGLPPPLPPGTPTLPPHGGIDPANPPVFKPPVVPPPPPGTSTPTPHGGIDTTTPPILIPPSPQTPVGPVGLPPPLPPDTSTIPDPMGRIGGPVGRVPLPPPILGPMGSPQMSPMLAALLGGQNVR